MRAAHVLPLVLGILVATARAAETEARWSVPHDAFFLYAIEGASAERLGPGGVPFRTVYGSDFDGGHTPHEPVGSIEALLWHYTLRLPEDPIESSLRVEVKDEFLELPQPVGPVRAIGELQAKRKGAVVTMAWNLRLEPAAPGGDLQSGTLLVTSQHHQKKGAIIAADAKLSVQRKEPLTLECRVKLVDEKPLAGPTVQKARDAMIERARTQVLEPYLKRKEYAKAGNYEQGNLAVVLYAALQAGLKREDPIARAALQDLVTLPLKETYSVALAILCLESLSLRRETRKESGATRMRVEKDDMSAEDKGHLERMTRWLIAARIQGSGVWGYVSVAEAKPPPTHWDHSNTQFAVLALHAAARSDIAVSEEVWREIAGHFLGCQGSGAASPLDVVFEKGSLLAEDEELNGGDGKSAARPGPQAKEKARRARGFDYNGGSSPYTSMSAAGASSLAICLAWLSRSVSPDDALIAKIENATRDGLAWEQRYYTMRQNWPGGGWPFYNLYSLEKLFELCHVETIGGHDWWAEGVQELVLREDPRGGFAKQNHSETALAVLFLTRATAEPTIEFHALGRQSTGDNVGAATEAPDTVMLDGRGLVRVTEVARACATSDPERRKEYLALLEEAFRAMLIDARPLVVAPLADHYDARTSDLRRVARELIEDALGMRPKDGAEAHAIAKRWAETEAAGRTDDHISIPRLRASLPNETAPAVVRAAALALSRLGGVEAVPDLINALANADDVELRKLLHTILIGLVRGEATYDPAASAAARKDGIDAWYALWQLRKALLLTDAMVLRHLRDLALADRQPAAEAALKAIGRPAIPALIHALGTKPARGDGVARDAIIARLLGELTGEAFGHDRAAWEGWWQQDGSKR